MKYFYLRTKNYLKKGENFCFPFFIVDELHHNLLKKKKNIRENLLLVEGALVSKFQLHFSNTLEMDSERKKCISLQGNLVLI